jgi:hypothetical protein
VYFGVKSQATYGIDPGLGEFSLPPVSSGEFDARFIDMNSRPGLLGEGVRLNLYKFYSYLQIDTFYLAFQPGIGTYPMTIKWNKSMVQDVSDTMIIKDEFTGTFVNVMMNNADSVVVTQSIISRLLIIVIHPYPVGVIEAPPPPSFMSGNMPKGYQLYQNYPNPFNPTTTVAFSSDHSAEVRLSVYDVLGREIAVLANGTFSPGLHQFVWDGKSDQGAPMPSGVYYARVMMKGADIESGSKDQFVFTRKMLMLK